jgi:PIN domain nuclease of toxin-antitoxin system
MYIADACALLAFFGAGDGVMATAETTAMRGDVCIAPVTIWELTRKAAIGKLPPLPVLQGSFVRHVAAMSFRDAPLLWADAEAANRLPMHRRDPMDRMLITSAFRIW